MSVLARRIRVNLQPRIPTSMGSRLTAHRDQAVRYATIVPALAPPRGQAAGHRTDQDAPKAGLHAYPSGDHLVRQKDLNHPGHDEGKEKHGEDFDEHGKAGFHAQDVLCLSPVVAYEKEHSGEYAQYDCRSQHAGTPPFFGGHDAPSVLSVSDHAKTDILQGE